MRGKQALLALLASALAVLLSGCFVKTVDELYTLPRHSDEYDRLELTIEKLLKHTLVQRTAAAHSCSGIGKVQNSPRLSGEHFENGENLFGRTLCRAFDSEINGVCLCCGLTGSLCSIEILHISNRHHPVHDHLRRLFITDRNTAVQDHSGIFIEKRAVLTQN